MSVLLDTHGIGFPGPLIWDVATLVDAVGTTLAERFGAVVVRGELGGFARAVSGHCYFTLKDSGGAAALRCAMFRRAAGLMDFVPHDGMNVEVRGRLAVYESRGELQLVVEGMRPAGAGALMEQFLRLKAKLDAEGLFASSRKREVPQFPRRVGVVTSLAAAALRDVLSVFARRAPHIQVIVYPAAVQGAEAPAQLVSALTLLGARAEVDLALVCRGGGSLEDLWAFNDERVVRAVAACAVPVISGVGHETDVTLTDFAADLRAPTPTAAAELAAIAALHAKQILTGLSMRGLQSLRRRLDGHGQRLDRIALQLMRPAQAVKGLEQRLALLEQRHKLAIARSLEGRQQDLWHQGRCLMRAGRALVQLHETRWHTLHASVRAVDPQRVVAAGYALVQTARGDLVREPAQLREGEDVLITLSGGEARVRIATVRR